MSVKKYQIDGKTFFMVKASNRSKTIPSLRVQRRTNRNYNPD